MPGDWWWLWLRVRGMGRGLVVVAVGGWSAGRLVVVAGRGWPGVGGGCGSGCSWWRRLWLPGLEADHRADCDLRRARVLVVAPGLLCWGGIQQRPEDVDRKSFIRKESPNTGTATVSPMSPTLAVTHHRWRPPAGSEMCLAGVSGLLATDSEPSAGPTPRWSRPYEGLWCRPRGLRSGGWVSDRRQQGCARQRTPERGRAMGRTCGWHSCAADPGAGQLRFRAGCGDQRPGSGPRCRPRCRGLCRPALGGPACWVRRDARCPVLRPRGRTHRRMGAAARVARAVEAARTPPVTAPDGPAAFGCGYGAVAGPGCLPRGRSHRRVGVSAGGWVVRRGRRRPRG